MILELMVGTPPGYGEEVLIVSRTEQPRASILRTHSSVCNFCLELIPDPDKALMFL